MTLCRHVAKLIQFEYKKEGSRIVELFENFPHKFKSVDDEKNLVKLIVRMLYPKYEKKIGFTGNKD